MCTVSYLPLPGSGFIFTSNRDESPSRVTNEIRTQKNTKGNITFPVDSKGGSWFLASNYGWAVCVLNGAFKYHKHSPPYKLSRGIMSKEVFNYDSQVEFLAKYDFNGIEPFTMIMIESAKLREVRWDGSVIHIRRLDPKQRYVWFSWTLYNGEMQSIRKAWFENWSSKHTDFSRHHVHALHRYGGVGDANIDYVMNRNDIVCTVSITQLVQSRERNEMFHYDLMHDQQRHLIIE